MHNDVAHSGEDKQKHVCITTETLHVSTSCMRQTTLAVNMRPNIILLLRLPMHLFSCHRNIFEMQRKKGCNESEGCRISAYTICTNKPPTSREHRTYIELQKQTQQLCKSAYNIIPTTSFHQTNPLITSANQRNDQSGNQQLQDKDGFIRSDSLTKANKLNRHFQSVFTQNEDISTIPVKGISPHPLMQHITITPNDIHKLLCILKNTKQLDQTTYPHNYLNTLADELTTTFTLFFQASLKQGTIPTDWTTSNATIYGCNPLLYTFASRTLPSKHACVSLWPKLRVKHCFLQDSSWTLDTFYYWPYIVIANNILL